MYVNHVNLSTGENIVDLRGSTVAEDNLFEGEKALNAEGRPIVGKFPNGEIAIQAALIEQINNALNGKAGGSEDLNAVLAEQEELIDNLKAILKSKASGGGVSVDTRFADFAMDNLTEIDDETITEFRPYAFCYADSLVSVRIPNARISASSVFRNCTNLLSVDLPELAGTSGGSLFVHCSNLANANIPKVTSLQSYAFQYCNSLKKLDLGNLASISAGAFSGSGLETLIIRRTGTPATTLSSTNAFADTPIANGTGHIYVYRDMIDKFKTATNFSTYANQFRAIEDYPEICGGD